MYDKTFTAMKKAVTRTANAINADKQARKALLSFFRL